MAEDITVRIAGENGEGVNTVGEVLAEALSRTGLHVYTFQNLPAEIKGGASMIQVRFGSHPVRSPGDNIDLLMVWNQENYDIHAHEVGERGVLMYDPNETIRVDSRTKHQYPVPLNQIIKEEVKVAKSKNVLAFAMLTSYFDIPFEIAEHMVRESRWGRRREFMESNLKALHAGYRYVQEHIPEKRTPLTFPESPEKRLYITGNQAFSLGAVAAGCHFMAGYPITPASDVMENMSKYLPQTGGVCVQCEDEIASLGAVIGASFAGKKAMTATSGPGVALMVEEIGLATMQEVPLVILDCQRGGPSTGMPTKTEQSDLDLAVYGHHGDAPRIVLAALDVEDCFYCAIQAFNMAERYQTPVLVLSDYHLSQRAQEVRRPDISLLEVVDRLLPSTNGDGDNGDHYKRYELTESGVSPMAIPGVHHTTYVGTGLEHDEHAHIDLGPQRHPVMLDKRAHKVAAAVNEMDILRRYGPDEADLGVICWGSSYGPVREAFERAEESGLSVAALFVKMIYPVPETEIREFCDSMKQVAVVELNHSGQYANLLQSVLCRPFLRYNKCTGLPFKAGEIYEFIERTLSNKG